MSQTLFSKGLQHTGMCDSFTCNGTYAYKVTAEGRMRNFKFLFLR